MNCQNNHFTQHDLDTIGDNIEFSQRKIPVDRDTGYTCGLHVEMDVHKCKQNTKWKVRLYL